MELILQLPLSNKKIIEHSPFQQKNHRNHHDCRSNRVSNKNTGEFKTFSFISRIKQHIIHTHEENDVYYNVYQKKETKSNRDRTPILKYKPPIFKKM